MSLRTAFTDLVSVQHPIALAPMGGSGGGALAAAVSNGGGLGLVGGGRGDRDWLDRELALVTEQTSRPWGVGFLSWAVSLDTVVRSLEQRPTAVMLSFGDPGPFAQRIREAGILLIVQVTDLDEAQRALDVGADLIIAQGTEAGGHGGRRGTLPLVPTVVDLAAPVPVLAAGGIADGRGLAAALILGAAGALVGTRFQASFEALVPTAVSKALLEARGSDTERSRVLDIARDGAWPDRYTGRALRNRFLDEWRDHEDALRTNTAAKRAYRDAAALDDLDVIPVWASEAVDLITELHSATDLVTTLAADAEHAITRVSMARQS
jgi:nitronate monooxygenase